MRLSFRLKTFLALAGLVVAAVAVALVVLQLLTARQTREAFAERFSQTRAAFRELQGLQQQLLSDEIDSLARGNAQFRTVLSTASLGAADLGVGRSSGDEARHDANLRLKSLLPALAVHDKHDIFVVADAAGRLLYSKADPDRYGDSLAGLPLLERIAQSGRAEAFWNSDPGPPGLVPAGPAQLYHVVGEPVVFGDQMHGVVLAGSRIDRAVLERIRDLSGVDLALYDRGALRAATLSPEAEPDLAGLVARSTSAGSADGEIVEWRLGRSRYLAMRAPVSPEVDPRQTGFLLLRSLESELRWRRRLQLTLVAVGIGILGLAIAAAFALARGITRPVAVLSDAARRVGAGDLSATVSIATRDEFAELGTTFNEMVRGLRERELIRRTFERYVSKAVAEEILRNPAAVQRGGVRRTLTAFFVDIGGFTGLSEDLSPEFVVARLNEYFEVVCGAVLDLDGTVNQFQGDGVVAFWGAPIPQADHAARACRAALRCALGLTSLVQRWTLDGLPRLRFRIGVHTGEMVVGEIGSSERGTYTAIGDAVNLASRLEGVNKAYGTSILISEATLLAAGENFAVREVDLVRVVGRHEPVRIYELLGEEGALETRRAEMARKYGDALEAYRRQEWEEARAAALAARALHPDDGPSRSLVARLDAMIDSPPGPDWDGVTEMRTK